jgi:hypothetical protein
MRVAVMQDLLKSVAWARNDETPARRMAIRNVNTQNNCDAACGLKRVAAHPLEFNRRVDGGHATST